MSKRQKHLADITAALVCKQNVINELIGTLRIFDRDDVPSNRVKRPSGTGVLVFMTYKKAERIRSLLREIT